MLVLVSLSGREISTAINLKPMKPKALLVLKLGATKSDSAVVSLSRSQPTALLGW